LQPFLLFWWLLAGTNIRLIRRGTPEGLRSSLNRSKRPRGETQMRKLPTLLLASVLLTPLAGCKTMGTGGIETSPCVAQAAGQEAAWRPISWSSKDTLKTIEEVKANNARHEAWCKAP